MGCEVEIKLETDADATAILTAMPQRFDQLEDQLSRFRPDSELMRLNARTGEWVSVSNVLFDNLVEARQAARLTEGLFNPLILPALVASGYDRSFEALTPAQAAPPQPALDWEGLELRRKKRQARLPRGSAVDLGGIAKGWAAQHIARDLAQYGPVLVNIGGDIVARGEPEGDPGWRVDIADPESDEVLTELWLRDAALVTSGIDYRRWVMADGQRYHHIIDPLSGLPVRNDVLAVSIIHPHAPTAEACAKAVLLQGSEAGLNWLNDCENAAGLVVRHDAAVLSTSNFIDHIYERTTP